MRSLLLCGFLLLACGGSSTTGGPCSTACDCTLTTTPLGCAGGEWQCNVGTCTFTCASSCVYHSVSTCPADSDCDPSNFCSARFHLGCQ